MTGVSTLSAPVPPLFAAVRSKAVRGASALMRARRIGTRRWLPSRRLARRSRGLVLGGVWLRFATWRRAYDLDRELAGGADPMRIDELALRVGHLGSTRSRARLACALRGAVELADRPPDPLRLPATRIQCSEVRANRELLLELAECLSTDRLSASRV